MYYEPIAVGTTHVFENALSEFIWETKYRYRSRGESLDHSLKHTWLRVAKAIASVEASHARASCEAEFYRAMQDFRLLPAGRILAGAGTRRNVTLFNTFVMQTIPDSLDGICETIRQAALTMQMGGGIGFDFSTIRPRDAHVRGLDCGAAGPLAAMDVCDAMCRMLVSQTGRGAMMGALRCDHPDIEDFIEAKTAPGRLRNFNLSVMVTDGFMAAVGEDAPWDLVWEGRVVRRIGARALWRRIMRRTYEAAEPGVLFIDRINQMNPIGYLETISATNSCAEQPLPPNGACPLASLNLARLVRDPFTARAALDLGELRRLTAIAVRMLDNVVDISRVAVEAQREEARAKRRIGIGVTGVADALIMLGETYGTDAAASRLGQWMQAIQNAAYRASTDLARLRGSFEGFDADRHLAHPGIARLDAEIREGIARHGLRNACLTTIAPTGTTSMLAGNCSSGIEPVFATAYRRRIQRPDEAPLEVEIVDYAVALHRQMFGADTPLPPQVVTAMTLRPLDHVKMQAAAQTWVDSAISKTVNCPEDISFEDFEGIYLSAYEAGCKGCTTYRPNVITGSVLAA